MTKLPSNFNSEEHEDMKDNFGLFEKVMNIKRGQFELSRV